MQHEDTPPGALLMSSMRAVGYSLQTAIADIVDNSISAHASQVDIFFDAGVEVPFLAVLDNGDGMSKSEAREAMTLAGNPATDDRDDDDLGRFGLGLKTASLSQCRQLTVLTKKDGEITALSWDLDVIESTRRWSLGVLDDEEAWELPYAEKLKDVDHGTLVVWRKLDRLLAADSNPSAYLDAQMQEVRLHLALVFHRFIAGETSKTTIRLNYVEVPATDPFLSRSRLTQLQPEEVINIGGSKVVVQAFTLPFLNRMSKRERDSATALGLLRDTQGFYVYRAHRLVVWGTWFRLVQKTELGRLTRVRVDIPNSLDHLWALDIKKSAATPPDLVRARLRELATTFVEPSQRVHTFRGRKSSSSDPIIRAWNLIEDRDKTRYQINRLHPALARLSSELAPKELGLFEAALELVESTLPLQDAFNRMSRDVQVDQDQHSQAELIESLLQLWRSNTSHGSVDRFVDSMIRCEPFDGLSQVRDDVIARLTVDSDDPLDPVEG